MTNAPLQQRNIGYVFQNYSLYPNMTAYDNLNFPLSNLKLSGMTRAQRKAYCSERINSVAKLLRIEDTLTRFPSELSGGQQQRIAIGRAIIRDPDILLMDEPFANLDRKLSVEMREEVKELQQSTGITTVFVTHNQSDANAISDKIILLNNGIVQQADTASEIYDRPRNRFVADFFGEFGSNIMDLDDEGRKVFSLISNIPPHQAASVSFRPEAVMVENGKGPFLVKSATRLGGSWLYVLQYEKFRLSVLSSRKLQLAEGVSITVDPLCLTFYDSTGTRMDQ
jgi:ABC-type sugar transport system ATPase subunit